MEKRVLVAALLSFLVFYAYQTLVLKPVPGSGKKNAPATAPATPGSGAGQSAPQGSASAAMAPATAAPAAPVAAPVVGDTVEREIVVETKTVRAVFTNRGAHLKSYVLKKYLDLQERPQELVPQQLPEGLALPFELKVDDEAVTGRLADALFLADGGSQGPIDVQQGERAITFEFKDSAGIAARKTFTFKADGYVIGFQASVEQGSKSFNPTVLWGPGLGDIGLSSESSSYRQKAQGMVFRGEKVSRLDAKTLLGEPIQEGNFPFAGVDDHYFIALAMSQRMVRVEYQPVTVPAPAGQNPENTREYVAFGVRQAKGTDGLRFFFGPKDFDVLASVDRRLVRAIHFGMFDWLAVPLLRALKWVNSSIGNYGWAIVVLTILINIVMFPLRHRSMVSMKKMQELQPEMKAIQDRYAKYKATDPEKQKMNQEVMNLYRSRGVNPASGCIPMLLTMPVLIAFYSLLSTAIELRGQPWILWIKDLSVHDPLYITPLLAGATQLLMAKISPTGGDPVQAKMMMWMMPIMFTVFFIWAPSGLVVYMLAGNIIGIGQQLLTNRLVSTSRKPGAEKKAKRA